MRCPYCGGLNSERASFCVQCGRDLPHTPANTRQQPYQPPRQQPPQAIQRQSYQPAQRPSPPQGAGRSPVQQQPTRVPQQPPVTFPPRQAPVQQPVRVATPDPSLSVAEPPAHFPPHTMEHLKGLQNEAVPFTLLDDTIVDRRKKVLRIAYRRCAAWQQVATLLKVFNEQDTRGVETVIVQGIVEREETPYEFSNGQLRFDRNVRLGSQTINRYQIETGTGLENDSLRIVLSE